MMNKRKLRTRRITITRVAAFVGACVLVWLTCLPSLDYQKGEILLHMIPILEMDKNKIDCLNGNI
jgi:hypothetical protein